jgi:hypothetical protein
MHQLFGKRKGKISKHTRNTIMTNIRSIIKYVKSENAWA